MSHLVLRAIPRFGVLSALVLLAVAPLARAETADRSKPMNIEADTGRYDDLQQVGTFTGNVVVTKGTMSIRASRIEVRKAPDGYQTGVATGGANGLSSFRQKRDGVDEYIEGEAERVEYDERASKVTLTRRAVVRRYRAGTLADETAGNQITYDLAGEVFNVVGGASAATPDNPGGRVRAVIAPRRDDAASATPSTPGARP